jgi:hypothetical protein
MYRVDAFYECEKLREKEDGIIYGRTHRINEVQDKAQWQAVVNTVMNLRFPSKEGNFLIH